ncbi:exosome complex exonuclease rrp41, putative [Acanthamoeba castellanii str. Neff]|uniref:Exosome complex exonuclease rrp41, putative n=1 Tax=Acanthamoeba castellanii (strain ATCC 30010 / Neff) TaxID=1257118 RepID=L8HIA7_ACACF|nr:exosome complex exonuclease rrp41, putative [Acanthamoeba castellanii str. Neff]ELR25324.1 exosome complex exonuclease rrp41, putative [Acanthamoeba castellanii str. Neff]
MSKFEFVSPEGLRMDGRRPGELRRIEAKMGVVSKADGSALFRQGNTQVLATIYGPKEAGFASGERKSKKTDKKTVELGMLIRQTFESVVMTALYPRSQIDIYVQVLQSDGGALSAAINATTLAMIDADPNFVENTAGGPELLVAIEPKSQLVVSMEMESKLPMEMYERVAKLAIDGCNLIYRVLTDEVRDYTLQLYQARSGIGSA